MQISPVSINTVPQFSSNDKDYALTLPKTEEGIRKEKTANTLFLGMSIGALALIYFKNRGAINDIAKRAIEIIKKPSLIIVKNKRDDAFMRAESVMAKANK